MRNRKKAKTGRSAVPMLMGMVLTLAVAWVLILSHGDWLQSAGEGAAILATALNMPDSGVDILRERFRAEIYGDEELPGTIPEQGEVFVPPQIAQPEPPEREQEQGPLTPTPDTPARRVPIPKEYTAQLISENFAGSDGGTLVKYGAGYIRNDTEHDNEDIEDILGTAPALVFEDSLEPQVLIVHTHATEAFERYDSDVYDTRNTWRSTDNNQNMVAVGNVMQEILEKNNIAVIHDTTQHDYPSYNGSYERSAETINTYLEEYPSIKVVLDLHRDAMQRDEAIVKPVAVIGDKVAAQIMIIACCDDGTMDIPEWKENLRFAATFQDYMERSYPDLTRPVFLCYRKYNMDLTTGSLLLEFGSNANTLEEAIYSAELAGQALSELIWDYCNEPA